MEYYTVTKMKKLLKWMYSKDIMLGERDET